MFCSAFVQGSGNPLLKGLCSPWCSGRSHLRRLCQSALEMGRQAEDTCMKTECQSMSTGRVPVSSPGLRQSNLHFFSQCFMMLLACHCTCSAYIPEPIPSRDPHSSCRGCCGMSANDLAIQASEACSTQSRPQPSLPPAPGPHTPSSFHMAPSRSPPRNW